MFCGKPLSVADDDYFHLKCCERGIFYGKATDNYRNIANDLFGKENNSKIENFAETYMPNFMSLFSKRKREAEIAKKEFEENCREMSKSKLVPSKDAYRQVFLLRMKNSICDYWSIRLYLSSLYLKHRAGIISEETLAKVDAETIKYYNCPLTDFEKIPEVKLLDKSKFDTPEDLKLRDVDFKVQDFATNHVPQLYAILDKRFNELLRMEKELEEIKNEKVNLGDRFDEIHKKKLMAYRNVFTKYWGLQMHIVDLYWHFRFNMISSEKLGEIDSEEVPFYK